MSFIDSISKGLHVMINDIKKPKSFKDGERFEDYVRDFIFPDTFYKILHKSHTYDQNSKDYIDDSKNPDYKFQILETKFSFHIECKYKNIESNIDSINNIVEKYQKEFGDNLSDDLELELNNELKKFSSLTLCNEKQFIRFKELNNTEKVFICLGLDNYNDEDIKIFLIPFDDLINNFMYLIDIDDYCIANNHYVTPNFLLNKIDFDNEAYCIRCKNNIPKSTYNGLATLCFNCWKNWYQFKNYMYKEKFCNSCGKSHSTSVAKPLCIDCYKKIMI